ncbi:LLM class flavin-dependent oxidoreductase [Chitinophaga sp.]|uniref:LLM class flavin-dependent oxidoreductase n=1 Tax=Chitinophaga sp. TaxID=1869181 RepID=UPI0031E2710C
MAALSLGLLEFGYHKRNVDSLTVMQNILNYIEQADRLGYTRFWLTEHHSYYGTSPWSNPEMFLPVLLTATARIKVGMAGILINYHSPYRVALNFKLLANLFSDRVDLGFANGTPSENVSRYLLQSDFDKRPDNYFKNIGEVHRFMFQEEALSQTEKIVIPPYGGIVPSLYLLSSFSTHLDKATELQLNFCKSLFHDVGSRTPERDKIERYREQFYKKYQVCPEVSLAVPFICASTREEALRMEERTAEKRVINTILGSPAEIHEYLRQLQQDFGVDEYILYDRSLDPVAKMEALDMLDQEIGLVSKPVKCNL